MNKKKKEKGKTTKYLVHTITEETLLFREKAEL